MDRKQVYEAIDGERDYQFSKWGEEGEHKNIEAYLVYMEHYLLIARGWIAADATEEALANLRRVVGVGVACFEANGVPKRT